MSEGGLWTILLVTTSTVLVEKSNQFIESIGM